jgi:DNA polymerase-3 subunit delta'
VALAGRIPLEAERQVLLLDEVHLMRPDVAPRLLKTLEEPAPRTVFVALADDLLPEMATIASRCTRVPFGPVPAAAAAARLREEGVDAETAEAAAAASAGDLARARLLAADPQLVARRRAWADVPRRLDGRGAVVAAAVEELLALIAAAAEPLAARQAEEVMALEQRVAQFGERGSGRADLEDRHKRELRRHRTDELLAGLAVLAGTYRQALVDGTGGPGAVRAVAAVQAAAEAFERNPNEVLLLQALLLRLGGSVD